MIVYPLFTGYEIQKLTTSTEKSVNYARIVTDSFGSVNKDKGGMHF